MHIVTVVTQRRIFAELVFSSSGGGRVLRSNLPQFGLNVGDRLEPSTRAGALTDVASFETTPVPFVCVFWRGAAEERCYQLWGP